MIEQIANQTVDIHLFYEPEGRLRATLKDRSILQVRPVWAAPASHPGGYLALLDENDKMVVMFKSLDTLSSHNRSIVEAELGKRYLSSKVTRIHKIRSEFGVTYWHVDTDRGPRDLVTQSLQENANWMDPDFLILMDVNGNKYEISVSSLDPESRRRLEATV
ncbi:MAG: DUF1854 domain-containing protein [Chthonomonadaceae bacterium]|jgi:hypothetical protein|nr:DUF1854 domain-containing protein [Chthonomonadaceae bacterium]